MRPIVEPFGEGVLPRETAAKVESGYEGVKKPFMVTDCNKCASKRVNHT